MESYFVHCPSCKAANRVPAAKEGVGGRCGSCGGPLPPLFVQPRTVQGAEFDSFVAGYDGPVLVEFWAPW